MADREGLKSTASILPKILANFCPYYQRYQSLATVAHTHFTSALGKTNRACFGSNGSRQPDAGTSDSERPDSTIPPNAAVTALRD
jgi:hypothetical protein